MELSNNLVRQFAKAVNGGKKNTADSSLVMGTVEKSGDKTYVKIDGSDSRTPVASTTDVLDGERVTVVIKNHEAFITGNFTSPSARSKDVKKAYNAAIAAGKVATDYITQDKDGITIGNKQYNRNIRITPIEVAIRNGDTDLARFAETLIELGLSTDFVLQIVNNAIRFVGSDGSAAIAHIGYGECNARNPEYDPDNADMPDAPEYTILSRPYYTLGSRSSDSTQTSDIGEWSIGAGEKVLASGVDSVAVGCATKATGPCAYAEGLDSEATGECAHAEGNYCKASDELCLGYGQYVNGKPTKLYGNDISLFVKSADASFRPYYRKGDSVSGRWMGAGMITGGGKSIYFPISLDRPIVGNPTVTVTNVNGTIVIQDNAYLYGTSSSTGAIPASIVARKDIGNGTIFIRIFNS